jgi:hypothetical protein
MSYMPSIGTIVKMLDSRVAIVSNVVPLGDYDTVLFSDGTELMVDAWQFVEVLKEAEDTNPDNLLNVLRKYLGTTNDLDKGMLE